MRSFGDFKGTPENEKVKFLRSIPAKDFLGFLEQKTDDPKNPSLAQLCFSKLELRNVCFEKFSELAKAAKQQDDEATIQSLNRLMILQDSLGYAGWHYLAAHNKLEEIQLLLAIADVKSFNVSMASQNTDGTGWLVLAYYQTRSIVCINAFMDLADAQLFNQAMMSQTKQGWTGWHVVVRNQIVRDCEEAFTNHADVRLFNQAMLTPNERGETGWMHALRSQKYDGLSSLIKKLNLFYCADMQWCETDKLMSMLHANRHLSADEKTRIAHQIKLKAAIFKDPINCLLAESPEDFVTTIKDCIHTTNDLETIKKLENALDDCMKKINAEFNATKSKLDIKLESVERRKLLLKNVEKHLLKQKQQLMVKKGLMHLRRFHDVNVIKAASLTEDLVTARKCFMEYGASVHSEELHKDIGFALIDGLGSFIHPVEGVTPPLPAESLLLALSLSSSSYRAFIEGLTHFQKALDLTAPPPAPAVQPVADQKDVKGTPAPVPLDSPKDLPDDNGVVLYYKACLGINAEEKVTAEDIKKKFEEKIEALAAKEAALPPKWGSLSDALKAISGKLEPADKKFLTAFAAEKFRYEMSDDANARNQHRHNMQSLVKDFIKVKQSKGFGIRLFQSGIPVEKLENIQAILEKMPPPQPKLMLGGG